MYWNKLARAWQKTGPEGERDEEKKKTKQELNTRFPSDVRSTVGSVAL